MEVFSRFKVISLFVRCSLLVHVVFNANTGIVSWLFTGRNLLRLPKWANTCPPTGFKFIKLIHKDFKAELLANALEYYSDDIYVYFWCKIDERISYSTSLHMFTRQSAMANCINLQQIAIFIFEPLKAWNPSVRISCNCIRFSLCRGTEFKPIDAWSSSRATLGRVSKKLSSHTKFE